MDVSHGAVIIVSAYQEYSQGARKDNHITSYEPMGFVVDETLLKINVKLPASFRCENTPHIP